MGGTRDWWEGDVIGGGGTRLVRGHVIGGQETRNWAMTQLIGGRRDWCETQLVGGTHNWWEPRPQQCLNPYPAFPGLGGQYLPQSWRVDTGPYACSCREGTAIDGNGDPDRT